MILIMMMIFLFYFQYSLHRISQHLVESSSLSFTLVTIPHHINRSTLNRKLSQNLYNLTTDLIPLMVVA